MKQEIDIDAYRMWLYHYKQKLNNTKMTNKQTYLDKIPQNQVEHVTQLLLRFYSTTTLISLNRALKSTEIALYTSELKNTSVSDLHAACTTALDILKSDRE